MIDMDAYRARWKSQVKCRDCGEPVDFPDQFVRCAKCRMVQAVKAREHKRAAREPEDPEAARARAEYLAMLAHCETCEFATFTGSRSWFCPLPVCCKANKE